MSDERSETALNENYQLSRQKTVDGGSEIANILAEFEERHYDGEGIRVAECARLMESERGSADESRARVIVRWVN